MNPLTQIKNTQKATKREIELGLSESASWHAAFKHSAYVFVGGLDFGLTEGDVLAVFSQYGEIVDLHMVRDKTTGKPRGFAFLAYEDQRSTNLAVDNLSGAKVAGRTVRVEHVTNYKKQKAEMDGEPVPEDEPPQEEPQAQAGGQQRTASPEPQRRDSHARAGPSGGAATAPSAPWAAPGSYLALLEEARQAELAAKQKQQDKGKDRKVKKEKKPKKEKKEKKEKKDKRKRSRSRSRSPSSSSSSDLERFSPGRNGQRAVATAGGAAPAFGPPRPPQRREEPAGQREGPQRHDNKSDRDRDRDRADRDRVDRRGDRDRDGGEVGRSDRGRDEDSGRRGDGEKSRERDRSRSRDRGRLDRDRASEGGRGDVREGRYRDERSRR